MPVLGNPVRAGGGVEIRRRDGGSDDPDGRERTASEDATRFRAMFPLCNFLGSDGPGLQLATKRASLSMAAPHAGDTGKVERMAKNLNSERRRIARTGDDGVSHAFVDSDWASCLRIRRSTSGGVLLIGQCTVKHWPATQRQSRCPLQVQSCLWPCASLGKGFGGDIGIAAWVDAWATICSRFCCGLEGSSHRDR